MLLCLLVDHLLNVFLRDGDVHVAAECLRSGTEVGRVSFVHLLVIAHDFVHVELVKVRLVLIVV